MQDPAKVKRALIKSIFSFVKNFLLLLILLAALFFMLNDMLFHINSVPTSVDIVRFLGCGAKPCVIPGENEACVYYIDVGQGDCELISYGEYKILIDSGDDTTVDDVMGFLRYSGVERLDLVFITHQHIDHMGGMYRILQNFDVGMIVMPQISDDSIYREIPMQRLLAAAELKNIPVTCSTQGERYNFSEDTYLQIFAPMYADYDNLNNLSLVLKFVHGDNSFLFTGDLENEGELDLEHSNWDLDCDVIKIGHHGSAGSSSENFLRKVSPEIAVFEVSRVNYYGHPRKEVIDKLRNTGCQQMYFTASNGNIAIVSDGLSLRVETEKE